jgi:cell division septal protein FtsQ
VFGKKRKNVKKNNFSTGKINKIRKFLFLFLLIIFLAVSFWILFFSPLVIIHNIKVTGFQEDFAREIVIDVLESPYLGIIPRNNILLAPSSKIERKIQEKMILTKNIEVKKIFPDSIEVIFSERTGVIIWCKDEGTANCFLIDRSGKVFHKVAEDDNVLDKFPIVYGKGKLNITLGEVVIKPELALFCSEINNFVQNELRLKLVEKYHTPSFMSGEIRASVEDQGWVVYFNSFSTAYEQSKLLKSFLEKNIKKEDFDKIEYIDLRLNGKVLYKLKEEQVSDDEDQGENQTEEIL